MKLRSNTRRLIASTTLALSVTVGVTAATTSTASANSSGWWTSPGGRAEGFYNSMNGRVYAGDLKVDGFAAITQVRTAKNGYFVVDVRDRGARDGGSWKTPTLYKGVRFKMRVCVFKDGHAPTKCGSWHEFDK